MIDKPGRRYAIGFFELAQWKGQVSVRHIGVSPEVAANHLSKLLRTLRIEGRLPEPEVNPMSVLLWIHAPAFQVLLTGDATRVALDSALSDYQKGIQGLTGHAVDIDLIKAPHHFFFSFGHDNPHGHPTPSALASLNGIASPNRRHCTQACRHGFTIDGPPPPGADGHFDLDLADLNGPLKLQSSQTLPAGVYHGNLCFHLFADGHVESRHQYPTPNPACAHHRPASGA